MLDCPKEPFCTISKTCLASSFPSVSSSTSSLMPAICSHAVCVLSRSFTFLSSILAYTFPDILGRLLPQQFAHCILLHFLCTWMIGVLWYSSCLPGPVGMFTILCIHLRVILPPALIISPAIPPHTALSCYSA